MNYLTHEIEIDLPALTMDRSINVLTLTEPVGPQDIPAIGIENRFTQAGKSYHQLQAMFVTEPPRLMVLTLSSHVPLGPGHRAVWMRLLSSLRLRDSEPATPAVPA